MTPRPDMRPAMKGVPGVYRDDLGRWWISGSAMFNGRRRTFKQLAREQFGRDCLALAIAERRELLEALKEGRRRDAVSVKRYTVEEWARQERELVPASPKRIKAVLAMFEIWFPVLGDLDIATVTPDDIRKAWAHVRRTKPNAGPAYQRKIHGTLAFVFARWAHRTDSRCVVERAQIALPNVRAEVPDLVDAATLVPVICRLAERRLDMFAYNVVAWATGMRGGEIRAMRLAHVFERFGGRWLRVPPPADGEHGKSPRMIPLTDFVYDVITAHCRRYGIASPTARIFAVSYERYNEWWVRCRAPQTELGQHKALRGGFQTLCVRLKIADSTRRQLVGHRGKGIGELHYIAGEAEVLREAMDLVAEYVRAELLEAAKVQPHMQPLVPPAPTQSTKTTTKNNDLRER